MKMRQTKGFPILESQLKTKLNIGVKNATEVKKGYSNRLFCLTTTKGIKLLAKFYSPDSNHGLQREFTAFKFLRDNSITSVPQAILKNTHFQFGVYSFEKGKTKSIKEYSRRDLDQMLNFIVQLQSFKPEVVKVRFLTAYGACLSIKDYAEWSYSYLNRFLRADSTYKKYVFSDNNLTEPSIKELVDKTVKNITTSLSNEEFTKPISNHEKRLNPSDFGAHNILLRPDRSLCFVDFEDFGWDDPIRIIADFIAHDQTRSLADNDKKYFIDSYKERVNLSKGDSKRLAIAIKLTKLQWLTYHLAAFTSEVITRKKFAQSDFDEKLYFRDQAKKLQIRIDQVKAF
ncbi:MAG: phosphotransferase [Patescibacteria group bacterium]|nr:phosphotransferase [Patescibacteria group bacterium]